MKRAVLIILLLPIHASYGMKGHGRRTRSNSTNSSPTQPRHKDTHNSLAHSDPGHIQNDPLFESYAKLNQKVVDQEQKIGFLTTKLATLETKVTRLIVINLFLVTSGIVVGVVWDKWQIILPLLRRQT